MSRLRRWGLSPPECARPRAQPRDDSRRVGRNPRLQACSPCCARGRAHSRGRSVPTPRQEPARHARRRWLEPPHGRQTRPRVALRERRLSRRFVRESTDKHGFFEVEYLLGRSMSMHPAVFAIGFLVVCFSAFIFLVKRARFRRWSRASGTVVELIRRESHEGDSVTFAPRVSFQTATGQAAAFVSSVSSFPAPRVGDTVAVLYDPSHPDDATLDRFMFRHLPELVFFCLGTAAVCVYAYQRFAAS